jgi:hypothetical protein
LKAFEKLEIFKLFQQFLASLQVKPSNFPHKFHQPAKQQLDDHFTFVVITKAATLRIIVQPESYIKRTRPLELNDFSIEHRVDNTC